MNPTNPSALHRITSDFNIEAIHEAALHDVRLNLGERPLPDVAADMLREIITPKAVKAQQNSRVPDNTAQQVRKRIGETPGLQDALGGSGMADKVVSTYVAAVEREIEAINTRLQASAGCSI
jgi:hypothetical protein